MARGAARGGPLCVGVLIFVKFILLRYSTTMLGLAELDVTVLGLVGGAPARTSYKMLVSYWPLAPRPRCFRLVRARVLSLCACPLVRT